MTPNYRPDIDGLRAVAVLSVLFFHTGMSIFSGGYVGVDIFFVISGFLITTIIIREIAANDFSLARFYERRFRRILPSLVVVILASLAAGIFLLTPRKLIDLGYSAIATVLFSSNMLFYSESGYFDDPAAVKPLLHTWTLAVEEQYYIFFPLLLVLISKAGARNYLKWLLILGVVSFIACIMVTRNDTSAAFYLIPTRAWELFVGSILALPLLPAINSRIARELLSLSGMLLIVYSVVQYTSATSFPGIAVTLPVLGAAFILYSGMSGESLITRLLSLRPLVFVGLVSYSLYLWHWPILVYTKLYLIKAPDTVATVAILLVIFMASVFSWRYIETPLRTKKILGSRRALFSISALMSLVILGCGIILFTSNGFPQRIKNNTFMNPGKPDIEWRHWVSCEDVSARINLHQPLCGLGKPDANASFILWGDSHAEALASGVDLSAKNQGATGVIATQVACPPLLSIDRAHRKSCIEFNNAVLKYIADTPEIKTVILAGRWALSTNGTRYKQEPGDGAELADVESIGAGHLSNVELFDIGLNKTITTLQGMGKRVVIVNPIPEIGFNVPFAFVVTELTGRDLKMLIAPTADEYKQRTAAVSLLFSKIKTTSPVEFVAVDDYFCDRFYCAVVANGVPLYRDDNHLSTYGSKYVAKAFDDVFKNH